MSRTRIWFARDCWLTSDFKVERIGLEFGADGVLAFEEVMALMKLEGAEDGTVRIPFTLLSRRAFIKTAARAKQVVQALHHEELIEVVQIGSNEFVTRLPRWARWQTSGDPRNAQRQARYRQRRGGSNGNGALFADDGESTEVPGADAEDQLQREFDAFLADHSQVTGRTPPGPQTKAYASLLGKFRTIRDEGRSLEDLKFATRGAYASEYRREHNYDKVESVLRITKVHDLIEDGRKVAKTTETVDDAKRDQERLEKAGLA